MPVYEQSRGKPGKVYLALSTIGLFKIGSTDDLDKRYELCDWLILSLEQIDHVTTIDKFENGKFVRVEK